VLAIVDVRPEAWSLERPRHAAPSQLREPHARGHVLPHVGHGEEHRTPRDAAELPDRSRELGERQVLEHLAAQNHIEGIGAKGQRQDRRRNGRP